MPCVFFININPGFFSHSLKVGNCFMFGCKFLEIIQVHKSTMLSLSTQALKLPQNFESKYFRVNEKERTTIDFIVYHQHIGSIGRSHKLDNGTWNERKLNFYDISFCAISIRCLIIVFSRLVSLGKLIQYFCQELFLKFFT